MWYWFFRHPFLKHLSFPYFCQIQLKMFIARPGTYTLRLPVAREWPSLELCCCLFLFVCWLSGVKFHTAEQPLWLTENCANFWTTPDTLRLGNKNEKAKWYCYNLLIIWTKQSYQFVFERRQLLFMCMVVFEITKFSIKSKQYYFTIVYSALSIHWAASLSEWVTISVHHTLTLHCWTDDRVRQRGQVRSREWRTATIRDVIRCMSVWVWSVQQNNYSDLHMGQGT